MLGRSVLRDDVGSGHCELIDKRCYSNSFAFLEQFSFVELVTAILLYCSGLSRREGAR